MTESVLSVLLFLLALGQTPATQSVEGAAPPSPPTRQRVIAFPERAMAQGITSGAATVNCGFLSDGFLTDCRIVSEEPAGAGFGEAALIGARRKTVNLAAMPRGANRVEFTSRFRMGEASDLQASSRPVTPAELSKDDRP